jgi:putative transcriptional regulator
MHNRLRDLRSTKGWSQADLAQGLSVSRQTVNALETGRYDPSLPLAFKIAELFSASIEEIFHPDGFNDKSPVSKAKAVRTPRILVQPESLGIEELPTHIL